MSGPDGRTPSRTAVPAAKLAAPRPLGQHVRRDRLVDILDHAAPDTVILISAPAGHGKTTLLSEWCAADVDRTAWVSLDQGDRTEAALCTTVLAALADCPAIPAASAIHQLEAPREAGETFAFVHRLAVALGELPAPVRLVLDDLHVLAGSPAMGAVDVFATSLGDSVQLVLATRRDPALPLARWRVSGRLVEVRSDQLAFTTTETRALVERTGLQLRPDQIDTLVAQTGGWAAGLRLATMTLTTTDDADAFLTDLAGNDRAIADYLVSEVLSRLPAESLDLLRRLSVCDQISATLAEALTDSPKAVHLLCALEQESSLVVSHGRGRQWFRIHPLLRAYLKADLRRSDLTLKRQLYARAASWYSAEGHPVEALDYASRSADPAVTTTILTEHALTLLGGGRFDVLRQAWRQCPVEAVDADPTLALVFALAFLDAGDATLAAELRLRADQAIQRHSEAETAVDEHTAATHRWLRSLVQVRHTWLAGDLVLDGLPATTGLTVAGETAEERALSHLTSALGNAAGGRLGDARRQAIASVRAAQLAEQPYVAAQATTILAVVAAARGELREASQLAAQADAVAPPQSWRDTAEQSVTAGLRCYAALLAGDPTHAISLAAPSIRYHAGEFAEQQPTAALATMVAAVARYDLGEHEHPLTVLRDVRERIPHDPLSRQVLTVATLWEQEIGLALGRLDQARDARRTARAVLGPTGDVAFMAACSAIARGRPAAALELLTSVVDGRTPPVIAWVSIAARVQAAALHLERDHPLGARRQLTEALRLTTQQGVLRPLIHAPAAVIDLLGGDPQFHGGEYAELITTVLGLRPAHHLDALPLTPRELEVLTMLPTLGSVSDIATDLSVSVNTVKTHLKAIYGKLGVDSRRKAVEAARRYGYLAS